MGGLKPVRRLSGKQLHELARTAACLVATRMDNVTDLSAALSGQCVEAARLQGLVFWNPKQQAKVAKVAAEYYETVWAEED